MAERVYTTEALVVGERPSGEASKVFTLFTRELGLLRAYARSVRELRSKLRYNLSLHSLTRVSLVPGREYWKLVGTESSGLSVTPRMCALINRFVGTHDPHPELFDDIRQGGDELALTWQTLDRLGYIGRKPGSVREVESLIAQAIYSSHL